MTVRRVIDVNVLNQALSNMEAAAEQAPEGSYEDAKDLSAFFTRLFSHMRRELSEIGFDLPNGDGYREVEAVLYGALRNCEPNGVRLMVAEGFGAIMRDGDSATRQRVMEGAVRDRDFLRQIGMIGGPAVEGRA